MSERTLLRGGWLITMVPGSEPFRGDLLIEDGRIAAVGRLGDVSDAEVVDARDRVVLPGLVDTHRHMWQSALRNIACDWTLGQYFARIRGQLGGAFRPEDTFAATLLGMVEALDSGITTVVDWSHNLNGPDHAAWDALQQGGGRALFAYGGTNDQALRKDESPHTRDVIRLRSGVGSHDSAQITLGMAVRGPEFSPIETCVADWALARELGLPVTVHVGGGLRGAQGGVAELGARGLLGPDTTYVHCNMLSDTELDMLADAGGRASVAPRRPPGSGPGESPRVCPPTSARTSGVTSSEPCGWRSACSAAPTTRRRSPAATRSGRFPSPPGRCCRWPPPTVPGPAVSTTASARSRWASRPTR